MKQPLQDQLKQQAAEDAVRFVESGMIVGLGTGSTARFAVNALAQRCDCQGLNITSVATSSKTAEHAQRLGMHLTNLNAIDHIDVAIDGADQVLLPGLEVIKGGGGALLQEKLVEVLAKRLIIIADDSKRVSRLGLGFAVPVEVVRFGYRHVMRRLEALGCQVEHRLVGTEPLVTDEGHYILDCAFDHGVEDPAGTARAIKALPGVVEHGLFIGMVTDAIIASPDGIEHHRREPAESG